MISPDLPITKSIEDKLDRAQFAESLARTILEGLFPSSMAIGLYGEWGSGKTSFVNMVLEKIDSIDSGAIILRFNPWLCTDPNQLISQFFRQLANAIKIKKPKDEIVWEKIDQYADLFDSVSAIPVAGVFISLFGKILAKKADREIKKRTGDFQKVKDLIIEEMSDKDIKIIVSIDDIDRLSEEEIIAVFQLVKSLADFPNTVYLLSFDYDVVVHALSKLQHGNGKKYLEKIIQIPFEIPAPNITNIYEELFSKLNLILGDNLEGRWDKIIWSELFQYGLKGYVKSIRDVIRYTNVFSLKYQLLKDETDPIDLLGLTVLQVFEPSIYSRLTAYKDKLCGSNYGYSFEREKEEKEDINKLASILIDNNEGTLNREAAVNILGVLFPRMRTVKDIPYNIGRDYSKDEFLTNHNIAAPECFDRYFALSIENNAIPVSLMKRLIYDSDEKELSEEMMRIYQQGKIIRLLDEIEAYAKKKSSMKISSDRASLIIRVLIQNWSSINVDDRDEPLSIPFIWRLFFCIDSLLNAMDLENRFSFTYSLFEDKTIQPSTLAILLQGFEMRIGRFTESASAKDNAFFSLEEVLKLEKIFITRAEETLVSGEALEQSQGLNVLWMLEKIDQEFTEKIKKTLVTDDISLIKILSYCTSKGHMTIKTVVKTRDVNRDAIGEFIDVNEAYQRVKAFSATKQFFELTKDDQMNAMAFILITERIKPAFIIMENCIEDETIERELKLLKDNIVDRK